MLEFYQAFFCSYFHTDSFFTDLFIKKKKETKKTRKEKHVGRFLAMYEKMSLVGQCDSKRSIPSQQWKRVEAEHETKVKTLDAFQDCG